MLDTRARKYIQPQIDKLAKQLLKWHCTPNQITVVGGALGVSGGILLGLGLSPAVCVILLWLSGLLDVVDGSMARLSKRSSPIGTLLDIVLDRVVEIAVLLALVHQNHAIATMVAIVLASIVLSMTVFLTAGAVLQNTSKKTFHYQAGLAERTEGFIILTLCMLFDPWQQCLLLVFAVMIAFTFIERFIQVLRYFQKM